MIDKNLHLPIYFQVKTSILEKIKKDIYKVGFQLPTDMEFCDIYNVSRITVRRALQELESDGYIQRIQGKGSYVRVKEIKQNISRFYSFTNELVNMGYKPSSELISFELVKPTERIREVLELDEDDMVFRIERLRLADDVIAALDNSYIPEKYIPNFMEDYLEGGSLYEALEKHYGFRPNNSEETIEAIALEYHEAQKMKLKAGIPQLLVERISYFNKKKVEFNYRIVNSNVYKYRLKLE